MYFAHDRLDVYRLALEVAHRLVDRQVRRVGPPPQCIEHQHLHTAKQLPLASAHALDVGDIGHVADPVSEDRLAAVLEAERQHRHAGHITRLAAFERGQGQARLRGTVDGDHAVVEDVPDGVADVLARRGGAVQWQRRALELRKRPQVIDAVRLVGMPEGFLPMTQAVIYLATAPKSNSALTTYAAALEAVKRHGTLPVPAHLRNAPTPLMKQMGFGQGYQYPHNFEGSYVSADYLPDKLVGSRFYEPGDNGWEKTIKERLEIWRSRR
jgi:hypothetical protein